MDMGAMFSEALKVMGIGVGSVFAVLAIFFGLIKGLMVLLPAKKANNDED